MDFRTNGEERRERRKLNALYYRKLKEGEEKGQRVARREGEKRNTHEFPMQ